MLSTVVPAARRSPGTAAGAASLGSSAEAPCSFCPAEATPAEGTGHAEAGARGARSAVHQRVRALVLLVLLVLVCHCPCPMDKDNNRQGQEEQEAQEPAPCGAPRFERRERRPPPVLSPRPESPQRGKKNKGPWHCCPEKLRRPRYRGKPAALRLLATVLLGTILCTLLAQHWRIDVGYVVEKCTTIASHHTAQLMIHIAV